MKSDGGEEFVPSTPPAPPHHEGVTEEEREDEVVQTCEVNFVPLEADHDVVVEDEGDVPRDDDDVVIEDDVRVEELEDEDEDEDDEGRGGYLKWQKRNMDKRKIEEVYKDIGGDSGETTQRFVMEQRVKVARMWEEQVMEVYEGKICELKEKLDAVSEGFMAAKRLEEHQAAEVKRLVRINLDRISDAERWRERCHRLAEINCREERKYETVKRQKRLRVQELQKELQAERRRNENLELELSNTRKRLLTFTRRSIPRRTTRVVRRIDSYEDGEESTVSLERTTSDEDTEETRLSKLITVMNNI